VDLWAAGVTLHIVLSGFMPFYHPEDGALAQIICAGQLDLSEYPWQWTSEGCAGGLAGCRPGRAQRCTGQLFGSGAAGAGAAGLGKLHGPGGASACGRARRLPQQRCTARLPARRVKDLLRRLLEVDPKQRLTAKQALRHPWLKGPIPYQSFTVKRLPPPAPVAAASRGRGSRRQAHRTTSDY
jgi:serine/threonine protein kinase